MSRYLVTAERTVCTRESREAAEALRIDLQADGWQNVRIEELVEEAPEEAGS